MGTSSDYSGGSGGRWTPAKYAATSFSKHGGRGRAERALGLLVAALGGASAATSNSQAARQGARRLASFFSAASAEGMDAALQGRGLGELVGRPATEVIGALIDLVGGSGEDRAEVAAREAACDVLEVLAETGTYQDLSEALPDEAGLDEMLQTFIAAYVYRLLLPVFVERFERLEDVDKSAARDREVRETVEAIVAARFAEDTIKASSWTTEAADAQIDALFREVFNYLEGHA
jgi:hypothetical protein